MSCDEIRSLFPDALTGELDAADRAKLEIHIAGCPFCGDELRLLSETWARLGILPTERPSASLSGRFYAMLEAERRQIEAAGQAEAATKRSKRRALFSGRRFPRPAFQFGLGALILTAGLGAGLLLGARGTIGGRAATLRGEVDDLRQTVAVALLDKPSSSDRLQGLSYTRQISRPGQATLDALLRTLDEDSSVSVRLAAADALYLFTGDPTVKDGILASLALQESPIVQVALIDLLVDMREKRAVDSLRTLIGKPSVDPAVRKQAENGIRQLTI
ncbi:MAG: HEAT repeat domain-containing protein [Acidobacteriota bacterium]|nr:HEAT repeat domain-containing protein [Acidobacteriota bacterium]